jgi:hypothetical protein
MALTSRRLVTTVVAVAATLGFVGVSAAFEGDDPSLGEPEVTCPAPSDQTADGGATDAVSDDGTVADDGAVTDEGTDATADGGTTATDAATDAGTDDAAAGDECEAPAATDTDGTTDAVTDDATDGTPEEDAADGDTVADDVAVENHGAAVSQAAHECPPGPEHGPCVREVAQSDVGKGPKGGDESTGDDESVEAGDSDGNGSDDTAVEDQGDAGSAGTGKGHGGGHTEHGH